jgi:methylmalonyl-CoA/ethylmalonyl-CoA epimerase
MNIGRLNHVAIAVPDLGAAVAVYRDVLGAAVGERMALPEHGVNVVFVDTGNSRIELMEPLGAASPLHGFLERHPAGGMHHMCFEVPDLDVATTDLQASGARVLGPPRIGAHGNPVVFLHPKDFLGTLIELEQVR